MSKTIKILLVGAIALTAVLSVGAMTPASADETTTCTTAAYCLSSISLIKLNPCQWWRKSFLRCFALGDLVLRPIATPQPSADCTLAMAHADTPVTDTVSARWAEFAVVCLVNEKRATRGMAPLTFNASLSTAGRLHSEDERDRNYFSHCHTDADGREPFNPNPCEGDRNLYEPKQRAQASGYLGSFAHEMGQAGSNTARRAVDAWMSSQPHREQGIFGSSWNETGVGVAFGGGTYGFYWTDMLGIH